MRASTNFRVARTWLLLSGLGEDLQELLKDQLPFKLREHKYFCYRAGKPAPTLLGKWGMQFLLERSRRDNQTNVFHIPVIRWWEGHTIPCSSGPACPTQTLPSKSNRAPEATSSGEKDEAFGVELAGKQSQYLQHKNSAVLFWTRAVFPRKRLNKGSIPSRSSAPQTGEHHLGFLQDGGERCLSLENNSSQLLGIKCLTLAICKLERRFISWKNNKYGSLTASSIPPPQAWSSLLNHCHREHIKTQQDSTAITTHTRTSQSNPAVEDTSLWNRHQTEKSLKLN